MAKSKEVIISEIEQYIRNKSFLGIFFGYSFWYCGITSDKKANQRRHKYPKKQKFWKCSSSSIARDIEKYFLNKNMKGNTGGGSNPNYVYVF